MKARLKNERIPMLSTKESLILELLLGSSTQEMYGLELVNRSRGNLKRGTVYVTLSRMKDKGFIEDRLEENTQTVGDQPRRRYRPTGYGARVYEARQMAVKAHRLMPARLGGVL